MGGSKDVINDEVTARPCTNLILGPGGIKSLISFKMHHYLLLIIIHIRQ